MSWLFPLYLAGAAAVVAPILLHLRRQQPRREVEFSSLMFLEASPLVTTTRRRLEHWLLLALRCLAILLLVAMFARPFWSQTETPAAAGRTVVLLLDRSATLQHADLWKQALERCRSVLASLTQADHVAIATFDESLQRHASFDQLRERSVAERQSSLASLTCGWQRSDLGAALRDGLALLDSASTASAAREIVVVSAFREGADLERLRGFAWPDNVTVRPEVLSPANTNNLNAQLLPSPESAAASALRLRVSNQRDSSAQTFELTWEGQSKPALSGELGAGASRIVSLPRPADALPHKLTLSGDDWTFDNTLHIAPLVAREARVRVLAPAASAAQADSPWFYLRQALQPTPQLAPKVSFGAMDPAFDWIIADTATPATEAPALRAWIEAGHSALCLATDTNARFLSDLLQQPIKLGENSGSDFALLQDLGAQSPALRPFRDARLRDFTKVRIWHRRRLDPGSLKPTVLAQFDDASPAWLAFPMGKGQLIVLLHGWQPRDAQLALSSKFVPLLFGLLEAAGVPMREPTQAIVSAANPQPGIIKQANGRLIAQNLSPDVSRVMPLEMERLRELGVKLTGPATQATSSTAAGPMLAIEEHEARQQAWLWVLVTLLAVLLLESWLASLRPSPEERRTSNVEHRTSK